MATEYLMKRESPMMNWMRYGTSPSMPPEAEMILEMRGTRQGVEALNERVADSLLHLRDIDDDVRRGNQSLEHLDETTGRMAGSLDSISSGLGELDDHFREGFSDMRGQLAEMGWDMRDGLAGVNETLQDGFGAVVTGLAMVDERLGQRLAAHFSALQTQLGEQHEELLTTLDNGFGQVSQAVLLSAEYMAKVMTANSDAQIRQMAREGDATRRMIAETSRQQIYKIEEVRRAVLNQDAHRAEEHFMVGLNDFNHGDLRRAYVNFLKAERIYGGHFPTLFMLGFVKYLNNRLNDALKYFQTALQQAKTAQQRGLACLYKARMYFTAKKFAAARKCYKAAFEYDANFLMTALVEGAAARLLAPDDDIETIVKTMKADFKECGQAAQHLYWYALALTLTPLHAEWAAATFGMGVKSDKTGGAKRDRQRVLATLRWLNARHVDALLALVQHEYVWLK